MTFVFNIHANSGEAYIGGMEESVGKWKGKAKGSRGIHPSLVLFHRVKRVRQALNHG